MEQPEGADPIDKPGLMAEVLGSFSTDHRTLNMACFQVMIAIS